MRFIWYIYYICSLCIHCIRRNYLIHDHLLFIYFLFFLGIQEGDKQLIRETSTHQLNSERYVHTFKDLSNFSGAINVTYRYLASTPLQRKRKYPYTFKSRTYELFCFKIVMTYSICIAIKVYRIYKYDIFGGIFQCFFTNLIAHWSKSINNKNKMK